MYVRWFIMNILKTVILYVYILIFLLIQIKCALVDAYPYWYRLLENKALSVLCVNPWWSEKYRRRECKMKIISH